MAENAWTLYGRDGCACCGTAAQMLQALTEGLPMRIKMVDVRRHKNLPRPASIPAFCDPAGHVVWEGGFDAGATRMALERWGVVGFQIYWNMSTAAA